ncbi:hypothetical protein PBN151_1164 [Paenibacillus sp. NAIST15-1]|nr:hypothetical protein PBN151_1164 [Paenibacillus sp. NAIST15-1]
MLPEPQEQQVQRVKLGQQVQREQPGQRVQQEQPGREPQVRRARPV